jgi:hypothetical protein
VKTELVILPGIFLVKHLCFEDAMTEAAKVSAFGGATHNLSHSFNSTLSLDEFLLQGLGSVKSLTIVFFGIKT